ncbi:MAG TPA: nodulation protein NfeD [Solirubrobacterales bacterium]|nr:nodulation protein NfeD [Solirubrobacterales bacterium]
MRGRRFRLVTLGSLALTGAALVISPALAKQTTADDGAPGGVAYSIELQATIDPATQKWISSALDDAASENAKIAIIRLDTPGGLSDSMRSIIQDMAAAPMPVVVYVSPNGARAGSAGAYITEAADVAAMAPETNIGSATPIAVGPGGNTSDLDRKIKNDAAASMRALASDHGRNPRLAGELVTQAKNLTAEEAKKAGLIDLIASDQDALLRQLDGFRVKGPKAQTLHTAGLQIENHDMPLGYELLEILVNPNVAYLLLLIGLVGLAIELFSPGLIAPGTIGVISLLLGLYGTAQLPVTVAGVLLLVFGVAMIIAEAHLPTHGILGASGVAALIAAGLVLYDTGSSAFEVSAPVVIFAGLLIGGFLAFAVERAFRARRQPARTGWEEMIGAVGEVRERLDPVGQIFVEGALWRAELAPPDGGSDQAADGSAGDGRPLERGSRVRVASVEGLTLRVRPL